MTEAIPSPVDEEPPAQPAPEPVKPEPLPEFEGYGYGQ